jgi:hypothetical protein
MRMLAEILEVADDAAVEGRTSLVNHNAIVEAAGTLRRIANRLAYITTGRIVAPVPSLDPPTESARDQFLTAIRRQLQSWLDFFSSDESLSASAAQRVAQTHSTGELQSLVGEFGSRVEGGKFAQIDSWPIEHRRAILAELQSMRRLEFLVSELNRWLARIPGPETHGAVSHLMK